MSDEMTLAPQEPGREPPVQGDGEENVVEQFRDLPIGMLLCEPVLEVARGQAALCDVYLANIKKIAYKNYDPTKPDDNYETNMVKFSYEKPIADKVTGKVKKQTFEMNAPLISLIPLPAFLMEELTVNFSMEVHVTTTASQQNKESLDTEASFSFWGCSADIKGSVSSDTTHSRQTDNSAKYELHLRAAQQPPAEGMAKLTSLFAQSIEPLQISQ
jgi:hypothetical protein